MTGAFLFRRHAARLARDPYKGPRLMLELASAGAALLSFLGYALNAVPFPAVQALTALWFAWTLQLSFFILKKDFVLGLASPLIAMMRDVAIVLGLVRGILKKS